MLCFHCSTNVLFICVSLVEVDNDEALPRGELQVHCLVKIKVLHCTIDFCSRFALYLIFFMSLLFMLFFFVFSLLLVGSATGRNRKARDSLVEVDNDEALSGLPFIYPNRCYS